MHGELGADESILFHDPLTYCPDVIPNRWQKWLMAKLYFYYSAMNAGKSTTLLQAAYNYQERGLRPLLLTPELDTRDDAGIIRSRIGLERQAVTFSTNDSLFRICNAEHKTEPLSCVFVDEAQFLTRQQVHDLGKSPTS